MWGTNKASSNGHFVDNNNEEQVVVSSLGSDLSFGSIDSWTKSPNLRSLSWEEVGSFSKLTQKEQNKQPPTEHNHKQEKPETQQQGEQEQELVLQVDRLLQEDEKKPRFNLNITEECIFELDFEMEGMSLANHNEEEEDEGETADYYEKKPTKSPNELEQEYPIVSPQPILQASHNYSHTLYTSPALNSVPIVLASAQNIVLSPTQQAINYTTSPSVPSAEKVPARKVLCKFFTQGTCKAGSECRFSHELEPPLTSPIFSPLQSPTLSGFSTNVQQATNSVRERRNSSNSTNGNNGPKYCKFFSQGYCRNGEDCPFIHQEDVDGAILLSPPMTYSNATNIMQSPLMLPAETPMLPKLVAMAPSSMNQISMLPSHITSPHMVSQHMTSPHMPSPHMPSPHMSAAHLTSPHMISPQVPSIPQMTSPILGKQSPPSPPLLAEASPSLQPVQETKQICPFFLKGECKFGDRCRNVHQMPIKKKPINEESLRKFSTIPCKYYHTQGECPFGSACYYLHDTPSSTAASLQQPNNTYQSTTFLSHMMNRQKQQSQNNNRLL